MTPTSIFKVFGRSPITPLQKHMDVVLDCAQQLNPFIEAVFAEDWKQAEELQNKIAELENKADQIKSDLRLHLPKNLFLPVPRSDLLELLSMQDNVADKARDIAGVILGRRMIIPTAIANHFQSFIKRSVDAVYQAHQAINRLDELQETGFRGAEVRLVEDMVSELDKIEHDTDEIQIKLRRDLLNIEETLSPIHVMFLYKVIERVGALADGAERVGSRLLLLLAR